MFFLERHERDSAVWRKLVAHFAERLETMRLTLEKAEDQDQSQKIRGRITEIRHLLELDKERQVINQSSPT